MFVVVIAVRRMKMPVVDVIRMTVVVYGKVSAVCAVCVRVTFVCRVIHLSCVAFLVLEVVQKLLLPKQRKVHRENLTASVLCQSYTSTWMSRATARCLITTAHR